jgi:hypothetical protein
MNQPSNPRWPLVVAAIAMAVFIVLILMGWYAMAHLAG